jgi:hypothetical protein
MDKLPEKQRDQVISVGKQVTDQTAKVTKQVNRAVIFLVGKVPKRLLLYVCICVWKSLRWLQNYIYSSESLDYIVYMVSMCGVLLWAVLICVRVDVRMISLVLLL